MELAIDAMHQSPAEQRGDGKASPRVGAVLWKPDGSTETASRGELRAGDHAEYTLLERKNHHTRLDGSTLLCTLEPCAPGSRHHPKLSCAERIVLARIKEVWVGITDPDPTVDRKGIKYLQDNGVTVRLFERDLQERIRAANTEFIAQAEQRAAEYDVERPQPPMLSALESALGTIDIQDLDSAALEEYRAVVGADPADLQRRLLAQGLVEEEHGGLVPTGFGLLLFGKDPRVRVPHAGLLGTIRYPDGTEEPRDFDGPAVNVPGQVIQWLRDKLPDPSVRTRAKRISLHDGFFELVREGVVNALVHRDYGIMGAKCQLVVGPSKVVVKSPGLPVEPITMEQLQSFEAPTLSRNPVMHFVFARMKLAEERGLGLESMRSRALAAGLPLPSYVYKAPYVILTLYRDAEAAVADMPGDVLVQLSESERAGWDWLVTRQTVTTAEYQAALGSPNRTAKNHLNKLTKLGLLHMVGAGPATRYQVVRP
jgi:ATP-dependent DNA helicase RecG